MPAASHESYDWFRSCELSLNRKWRDCMRMCLCVKTADLSLFVELLAAKSLIEFCLDCEFFLKYLYIFYEYIV
mgnify:FL=1